MKCSWLGCKNKVQEEFYSFSKKPRAFSIHCAKHNYMKVSGRVSDVNYKRDFYREHMVDVCALSEQTFKEKYLLTKKILRNKFGYKFEKEKHMVNRILQKRKAISRTMKLFEVDHIDGNHKNNKKENLQTLTKEAHKLKSLECGDFDNTR